LGRSKQTEMLCDIKSYRGDSNASGRILVARVRVDRVRRHVALLYFWSQRVTSREKRQASTAQHGCVRSASHAVSKCYFLFLRLRAASPAASAPTPRIVMDAGSGTLPPPLPGGAGGHIDGTILQVPPAWAGIAATARNDPAITSAQAVLLTLYSPVQH
jgi:hypothetical protein